MSLGRDVRSAYIQALKVAGQTIVVHNDWNTQNASTFEVKGMVGETFDFPEVIDVKKGSILQVKGSRDFWRVVDTEDHFVAGELIHFMATVEKIDQQGNATRPSSTGNAIFNAPVHGGVQVGGTQNTQHISLGNDQSVDNLVSQLVEMLQSSSIPEIDKEDAVEAAQRLPQLAQKEQTPDVVQRAKDRIELVKSTVEAGSSVAQAAAPILAALKTCFGF